MLNSLRGNNKKSPYKHILYLTLYSSYNELYVATIVSKGLLREVVKLIQLFIYKQSSIPHVQIIGALVVNVRLLKCKDAQIQFVTEEARYTSETRSNYYWTTAEAVLLDYLTYL